MHLTRRTFALSLAASGTAAIAAPRQRYAGKGPAAMLDTLVLGAGMSGLNTAWLLEQQGQRVAVLEARQRVGGRVYTLSDQPGLPEMGFNSMGAAYGRAIDAAKRAGVKLVDVSPRYRASGVPTLFLEGKPYTRAQWAASTRNPFPDAFKTLMPWEVVNQVIAARNPLLDWTAWTDPANAALDVSLQAFLNAQGLSDAAVQLAYDTSPYFGASAQDVSALMLEYAAGFVKSQSAAGGQSFAVVGGNSRLPEGMAKLLKGDVILGKEVVAVDSAVDAVTATCLDGAIFRAKRIVCTLPFAVLRRVRLTPALTGKKAKAVATIGHQPLSVAFLTVKSRFWEQDKLGPSMWTDGPLGTVLAQNFGPTENDVTGLLLQGRGELARYWDRRGRDAALALMVKTLEDCRPAAKGQVTGAAYHSWEQEAFSGGAWNYWHPGQIADFAAAMAVPAGRLHFAGEQTATSARGVEGALESSERVALEVLAA